MRLSAAIFASLALLGCLGRAAAQPSEAPVSPAARAEPLALRLIPTPFEFREAASSGAPARLKPLAAFALRSEHRRFGGVSSLAFGPGGALFGVTDMGRWLRFDLEQDSAGRLIGVAGVIGDLSDGLGAFPKEDSDSEALAFSPDGRQAYVAFERRHRIWRYDLTPGGGWPASASQAFAPTAFRALTRNRGIESLGVLPDGALLVIAENSRPGDRAIPGWILRGEDLQEIAWRPRDGFLPTDLDVGPDGFVYVLERRVSFGRGWAARIRRFPLGALEAGGLIDGETFAEFDNRRHVLDNMEGLALRFEGEGAARRLRLYMASDDNFLAVQRNLLIQFEFLEEETP